MNSYKQLIVNVGLIFFLTACGGSGDEVNDNTDIVDTGGSENTNEATALSGILFDAPIENMTYDSGSYQGVTTSEGKYNYNEGENVIFTLGNYQFSSVTGSELISLIQLLGAEEIDEQTLNLARLLQTIDQNDDEDVITLPDLSAVDLSLLNFQQTLENFENSDTVQTVLAATTNTDELISSGQALVHLLEQFEIYAANESFTVPEISEDLDEDGDGIADVIEDSDGDGVYNSEDAFPNDASESLDTDQDGTGDNADNDDDNDGTIDSEDAFPNDATETTDTDGDGVGDQSDAFPTDANETKDSDLDGVGDNSDAFPNDANETTDSDGDGVGDQSDPFPNDAAESKDSDFDGVGDNSDAFPNDPTETNDSDNDGVGDQSDAFPNDAAESKDSDFDGVGDNSDAFPNDATESKDSDLDGVGDNSDAFPNDATETVDSDNDGVGDNSDDFPNDETKFSDCETPSVSYTYTIVDTNQTQCYKRLSGDSKTCDGEGQDADYIGNQPSYNSCNSGSIVVDENTGLMWQASSDTDGVDGLTYSDQLSQKNADSFCSALEDGNYDDWRLPSTKELVSIYLMSGEDLSAKAGATTNGTAVDTTGIEPFIDTTYFDVGYGDTDERQRIIDGQYATSTLNISQVFSGITYENINGFFGVNFADGHIKSYENDDLLGRFYTRCVRGNTSYGENNYNFNDNGTVTDIATNLMWQQDDSGTPANDFDDALAICEDATTGGFGDWRLPNMKELHSIVDYSNSPEGTLSPAIDNQYFNSTSVTNEAGQNDWGAYWTSTALLNYLGGGNKAAYITFGRGLGYYSNYGVVDVHGAGAQRSDSKSNHVLDNATSFVPHEDSSFGDTGYTSGPQGDLLRPEYNYVRCVRDNVILF